jgi:hypothetical protein
VSRLPVESGVQRLGRPEIEDAVVDTPENVERRVLVAVVRRKLRVVVPVEGVVLRRQ